MIASTSLSAVGEKNYTYDEDSESITKLRQEIETQMREYTWADEIEYGIMIGKYDRPPGAKEYAPPKEPMPRPTPPLPPRPDLMPYFKNFSTTGGIAAGYQVFGGDDKPAYCGRVYCRTNSISNLKDNAKEWHVLHEWGRKTNGEGTENCIVITRSGNWATFGIYISSLGGYQYWVHHPANHLISIGIRPEHGDGYREYTKILFWVWDITTGEWWSKTYTLPQTELIYSVDAALEQDTCESPNSLWKSFYKFSAFDKMIECVDLKSNFGWLEYPSPGMNNEHVEDYYDDYGPNTVATLWQRKTPK